MNNLVGRMTEKNIFKEIEETLIHYKLKWNLLRCVTLMVVKIYVE